MTEQNHIEQRLRTALRAVAELPSPFLPAEAPNPAQNPASSEAAGPAQSPDAAAAGDGRRRDVGRRDFGWYRQPRLLLAIVSVAALALVVALALTFGPHNSAPSGIHRGAPASHPAAPPHSTMATTPTPTTATTTTTTGIPSPPLGFLTEEITYQPFTGPTLRPALQVTGHQSGTCFQYGGGAEGRYLYRCGTLQPCVAGSDGTAAPLACPVDSNPTTNKVLLWTATSIDTTGFTPATAKTPFAMQLSNGVVCALVDAAWSGLGPFGCGTTAGVTPADCRQPVATAPRWTAECQDQLTQSSPFRPTTVVSVWF